MTHRGYVGQVLEVRPVLAAMEDRGLPVDDVARIQLDVEFAVAQEELGRELSTLAPKEIGRVHPKAGYKGIPPEVKVWSEVTSLEEKIVMFNDEIDGSGESYCYERREFKEPDDDLKMVSVMRWVRVYNFNPNSSQQLLSYMKSKKHKVPKSKKNEDADGNAKDTTEKKELVRLAHKTGDTFYLKVIEYREFSKMRGTYIEGFKPGGDGRVHATFTFDTGTGQLAARNPNVTNFPKRMRLAKQIRRMIAAPSGQVLVECDKKSYHVVTTGYCAEDASYIRMAKLDMHSFVAGHLLKCWDATKAIDLPDEELLTMFKWLKSDPKKKYVRDNQAKPTILMIGFGGGYRRIYSENIEHFKNEAAAKNMLGAVKELFPRVFEWQDKIRKKAHEEQKLISAYGHIRRFFEVYRWDPRKGDWAPGDQSEEAIAFLPANIAFGGMRETMKIQASLGLDEKYGFCNSIHDSFIYCFDKSLVGEFIREVIPVLRAPSQVLKHPVLCPEGLIVDVEMAAGDSWASMNEVTI